MVHTMAKTPSARISPTLTRRWLAPALLLALPLTGLLWATEARAGSVHGVVQLSREFSVPPLFSAPGYWRNLRNGVLKVLPPLLDPRQEMVVTLEGKGLPAADQVKPTLTFADMRLTPPVLPVRSGTNITVRNTDPVPHDLQSADKKTVPLLPLAAGAAATISFPEEGPVELRCGRYPHIVGRVLVLRAPRFALPAASGAFTFEGVPDGTHTLRVWFRGRWIHSQRVTVKRKTTVKVQLPEQGKEE